MSTPTTGDGDAPGWLTPDLGGLNLTIRVTTEDAFAQPSGQLATADLRLFTFGNRVFNTNWAIAPASVSGFDGLGPVFNRVSCSACHTRDGRGQPPSAPGETLDTMLVRISLPGRDAHGGPVPVPHYGDQLNERAIPGVPAEGRTVVRYGERLGRYPDGTPFSLAVPRYEFVDLAFGIWPRNVRYSPRVAPPVFGLGLLETVPEQVVLEAADPDDADHDGISGRPNRVWDIELGRTVLGRFGWKANQPHLRQQNAAAALGDIGLTSTLYPEPNVAQGQDAAARAPSGGAPELADQYLDRLTLYERVLAVPAARDLGDPAVRSGARLFEALKCVACHRPTLKTGDQATVPLLAWQTIHPFTDLLLHDMGDGLADGREDFEATDREWRTPPLWGIGLTATVNRHTRFLHDGRARSIEEAILWHDGEAAGSRDSFMHLSAGDRASLLKFLQSL
ncbi:MAG: di-heme oxidoredictase family protein [Gammaproteobacteria bacterium]